MADPRETGLPVAAFFNIMRISHNPREFFLELGQGSTIPGVADLIGRFVTTPSHMKAIATVMSDNIRQYEEKFGAIPDLKAPREEA